VPEHARPESGSFHRAAQPTGEARGEPTDASATLLYDFLDDGWAHLLLRELDIRVDLFPDLVASQEVAGRLTSEAARELGIKAGIPVAAGAADTAATLVGQGLTLPWLIRHLGVLAPGGQDSEEVHARLAAVEAALQRLEELKNDFPTHLPLIDQLREEYEHEAGHVVPEPGAGPDEVEQELIDHRAIRNAVLVAQREAVIGLRDAGVINDETLRSIERDLDLEAVRTGA